MSNENDNKEYNVRSYIPNATNEEEWISKYSNELEEDYFEGKMKEQGINYKDPDGNSFSFYKKLALFLNIQEESLKEKLKEKYTYKAMSYKSIYLIEVRNEKNEFQFYLKSDQFGFSAPSSKKNHPYDLYLEKTKCDTEDKKIEMTSKVAKWVYESRSLGGSFLWPIEKYGETNPEYNKNRGGSKNGGSYIEDRVDLTLLEVMHVYNCLNAYSDDILFKIILKYSNSNMGKWLRHFMDFETYCNFFCFNDFISDNYIPYDITNIKEKKLLKSEDNIRKKDFIDYDKKRKIYISENKSLGLNELEKMLEFVNYGICNRTNKMNEIIKQEYERSKNKYCKFCLNLAKKTYKEKKVCDDCYENIKLLQELQKD